MPQPVPPGPQCLRLYRRPDGLCVWCSEGGVALMEPHVCSCDYVPGERRCLLTTWATHRDYDHLKPTEVPFPAKCDKPLWYHGCGWESEYRGKLRPGRFLPNHLRPLMPVFEIVSVKAERVQEITEEEAEAEGVARNEGNDPWMREDGWIKYPLDKNLEDFPAFTAKESFQTLWNSINESRGYGWQVNPWVWVISFRKI